MATSPPQLIQSHYRTPDPAVESPTSYSPLSPPAECEENDHTYEEARVEGDEDVLDIQKVDKEDRTVRLESEDISDEPSFEKSDFYSDPLVPCSNVAVVSKVNLENGKENETDVKKRKRFFSVPGNGSDVWKEVGVDERGEDGDKPIQTEYAPNYGLHRCYSDSYLLKASADDVRFSDLSVSGKLCANVESREKNVSTRIPQRYICYAPTLVHDGSSSSDDITFEVASKMSPASPEGNCDSLCEVSLCKDRDSKGMGFYQDTQGREQYYNTTDTDGVPEVFLNADINEMDREENAQPCLPETESSHYIERPASPMEVPQNTSTAEFDVGSAKSNWDYTEPNGNLSGEVNNGRASNSQPDDYNDMGRGIMECDDLEDPFPAGVDPAERPVSPLNTDIADNYLGLSPPLSTSTKETSLTQTKKPQQTKDCNLERDDCPPLDLSIPKEKYPVGASGIQKDILGTIDSVIEGPVAFLERQPSPTESREHYKAIPPSPESPDKNVSRESQEHYKATTPSPESPGKNGSSESPEHYKAMTPSPESPDKDVSRESREHYKATTPSPESPEKNLYSDIQKRNEATTRSPESPEKIMTIKSKTTVEREQRFYTPLIPTDILANNDARQSLANGHETRDAIVGEQTSIPMSTSTGKNSTVVYYVENVSQILNSPDMSYMLRNIPNESLPSPNQPTESPSLSLEPASKITTDSTTNYYEKNNSSVPAKSSEYIEAYFTRPKPVFSETTPKLDPTTPTTFQQAYESFTSLTLGYTPKPATLEYTPKIEPTSPVKSSCEEHHSGFSPRHMCAKQVSPEEMCCVTWTNQSVANSLSHHFGNTSTDSIDETLITPTKSYSVFGDANTGNVGLTPDPSPVLDLAKQAISSTTQNVATHHVETAFQGASGPNTYKQRRPSLSDSLWPPCLTTENSYPKPWKAHDDPDHSAKPLVIEPTQSSGFVIEPKHSSSFVIESTQSSGLVIEPTQSSAFSYPIPRKTYPHFVTGSTQSSGFVPPSLSLASAVSSKTQEQCVSPSLPSSTTSSQNTQENATGEKRKNVNESLWPPCVSTQLHPAKFKLVKRESSSEPARPLLWRASKRADNRFYCDTFGGFPDNPFAHNASSGRVSEPMDTSLDMFQKVSTDSVDMSRSIKMIGRSRDDNISSPLVITPVVSHPCTTQPWHPEEVTKEVWSGEKMPRQQQRRSRKKSGSSDRHVHFSTVGPKELPAAPKPAEVGDKISDIKEKRDLRCSSPEIQDIFYDNKLKSQTRTSLVLRNPSPPLLNRPLPEMGLKVPGTIQKREARRGSLETENAPDHMNTNTKALRNPALPLLRLKASEFGWKVVETNQEGETRLIRLEPEDTPNCSIGNVNDLSNYRTSPALYKPSLPLSSHKGAEVGRKDVETNQKIEARHSSLETEDAPIRRKASSPVPSLPSPPRFYIQPREMGWKVPGTNQKKEARQSSIESENAPIRSKAKVKVPKVTSRNVHKPSPRLAIFQPAEMVPRVLKTSQLRESKRSNWEGKYVSDCKKPNLLSKTCVVARNPSLSALLSKPAVGVQKFPETNQESETRQRSPESGNITDKAKTPKKTSLVSYDLSPPSLSPEPREALQNISETRPSQLLQIPLPPSPRPKQREPLQNIPETNQMRETCGSTLNNVKTPGLGNAPSRTSQLLQIPLPPSPRPKPREALQNIPEANQMRETYGSTLNNVETPGLGNAPSRTSQLHQIPLPPSPPPKPREAFQNIPETDQKRETNGSTLNTAKTPSVDNPLSRTSPIVPNPSPAVVPLRPTVVPMLQPWLQMGQYTPAMMPLPVSYPFQSYGPYMAPTTMGYQFQYGALPPWGPSGFWSMPGPR